ncbi:MAG: 6-bladed beta-propeller [Prevotellaceae bacterium]|jgi:hypothetical protein|nr:6-bladed beta-propeller [Prevotellaceae bacterium]
MKILVLICLSIAVFISSCQKGENVSGNTIPIELPAEAINSKEIAESEDEYFDSMKYIQLESKEDITLGKIDKILITENRIYILDIFKYGGVIIYDREGQIVNAIDRRGQGPEEYNYIFGIFYDQQDSTINLLCRYPNKIMKFDQDGYLLIKQIELPVALIDIKKSTDGYYIGYAGSSSINNSYSIYIFSEKFKLVASEYPNHKEWQIYRMDNTLSSYSDNIYFTPMYGYTVYTIKEKSIAPLYVYDFGKNNKVLMVGNPVLNPKIWKLYKQTVSGQTQTAINTETIFLTNVVVEQPEEIGAFHKTIRVHCNVENRDHRSLSLP